MQFLPGCCFFAAFAASLLFPWTLLRQENVLNPDLVPINHDKESRSFRTFPWVPAYSSMILKVMTNLKCALIAKYVTETDHFFTSQKPVSRNIDTLRRHIAESHPEDLTTPPKKRSRSVSTKPMTNEWTANDTNEAHLLLAQAVLECALPFSIVEHPAIVALFKKTQPCISTSLCKNSINHPP